MNFWIHRPSDTDDKGRTKKCVSHEKLVKQLEQQGCGTWTGDKHNKMKIGDIVAISIGYKEDCTYYFYKVMAVLWLLNLVSLTCLVLSFPDFVIFDFEKQQIFLTVYFLLESSYCYSQDFQFCLQYPVLKVLLQVL